MVLFAVNVFKDMYYPCQGNAFKPVRKEILIQWLVNILLQTILQVLRHIFVANVCQIVTVVINLHIVINVLEIYIYLLIVQLVLINVLTVTL